MDRIIELIIRAILIPIASLTSQFSFVIILISAGLTQITSIIYQYTGIVGIIVFIAITAFLIALLIKYIFWIKFPSPKDKIGKTLVYTSWTMYLFLIVNYIFKMSYSKVLHAGKLEGIYLGSIGMNLMALLVPVTVVLFVIILIVVFKVKKKYLIKHNILASIVFMFTLFAIAPISSEFAEYIAISTPIPPSLVYFIINAYSVIFFSSIIALIVYGVNKRKKRIKDN